MSFLTKIFGDYSTKEVKRIRPLCDRVLALDEEFSKLTDSELQAKTPEFKQRLANGETLDDILPEAFAACREASWRVLGLKHFPVQIIGGIILHQGRIAEMKTGEGKTLVATLPAYLNALSGDGVHIVTVNDYLARRDSEWMGKVYRFMGMTVGLIIHEKEGDERKQAYAADITYGTNNEMGFDYLRDNMVVYKEQKVQRGHNYAIVDEVDSILIDEARTPLIISGRGEKSTDLYKMANRFAVSLKAVKVKEANSKENIEDIVGSDVDYVVDEKAKTATLTKSGIAKAEAFFHLDNLMDPENMTIQHHINQAIKANGVMKRDVDYVVKDNEVLIVDEFTGRIMLGRRYNEGLHQAIEAKENVSVEHESKTLATITFQNYFRLYKKLSGMTGTAMTESAEFNQIYGLDVIEIPTNKPMIRKDLNDVIYKTEKAKFDAVIDAIEECHAKGQPVLVGTVSIEKSELLSAMLKRRGIKHEVLNAKHHEKEAEIVAQAGKENAVTIATNMAGRGTDIKLTPEVRQAGGLAIIGTERHDSRRVDRQLRGRAGRQGDPGTSQFYISLEDNLMRLFASERLAKIMAFLGVKEGDVIQDKRITKMVEKAQKRVEENHFGSRKNTLEYDNVMNSQREVIYTRRRHALFGERLSVDIANMIHDTCFVIADEQKNGGSFQGFDFQVMNTFAVPNPIAEQDYAAMSVDALTEALFDAVYKAFQQKLDRITTAIYPFVKNVYETQGNRYKMIGVPFTDGVKTLHVGTDLEKAYNTQGRQVTLDFQKNLVLSITDDAWKQHLRDMDDLRESVRAAVYEQKDPVLIYKFEAYDLFQDMIKRVNAQVVSFLFKADLPAPDPQRVEAAQRQRRVVGREGRGAADGASDTDVQRGVPNRAEEPERPRTFVREQPKIGRNDRVRIQNIANGEVKELKFKQAEPLLADGKWVIVERL